MFGRVNRHERAPRMARDTSAHDPGLQSSDDHSCKLVSSRVRPLQQHLLLRREHVLREHVRGAG
jgi:hypothetical protein